MSEKRILIADADSRVLEEFQAVFNQQWDVVTVDNGAAALAELKAKPYDALVASLDLPEVDGAELMNRARKKHPQTVRLILAEETDKDRVMKKVLGAHQFLTKPVEPETLKSTLVRALALDSWMANEGIRELVAKVRTFPAIPSLYAEVLAALRSPNATTEEIGAIVAKDLAMMTKLLQVINSAYFGLSRRITDPAEAVGLLGFETVKSMVVAIKLLNRYEKVNEANFSIDKLWRHSTEVARIAKELTLAETGDRDMADTAYTAALLHDVGKVLLASSFDEQYQGVQSLGRKQQVPLWEAEQEIFGANHGEIVAYLLGLWGMPLDLLEATAFHHHPTRSPERTFTPLTAVHVANVLEYELHPVEEESSPPLLDEVYLTEIGVLDRVDAWRKMVGLEPAGEPEPAIVKSNRVEAREPFDVSNPVQEITGSSEKVRSPASKVRPARARKIDRRHVALAALAFFVITVYAAIFWNFRPSATERPAIAHENATTPPSAAEMIAAPADRDGAVAFAFDTNSPEIASISDVADPSPASAIPADPESGDETADTSPAPENLPVAFPNLHLQAIAYSAERPVAIINGEVVRVNDRVEGALVLEIDPSTVVLEFDNKRWRLHVR